jgi:cytochrome c oxidase assembly protein subunit 15
MRARSAQSTGTPRRGRLFGWSLTTLIVLFVANVIGFTDTATGSVYGCGHNWPLCNGQLVPTKWNLHEAIEYSHRVSVFAMEVLLVVVVVLAWRWYGRQRWVRLSVGLMILGVVLESALGALAVFAINPPALMATHMGIALLALGGLTVMTLESWRVERGQGRRSDSGVPNSQPMGSESQPTDVSLQRWSWGALVYSWIAIYVGAYVASTGDGASFRGWPLPTESYAAMPSVFFIDVLHRTVALGMLLITIRLCILTYKTRGVQMGAFRLSLASLVLVCLQALSGAWLIASHMGLPAFLAHVSFSSLLFAALCGLTVLTSHQAATGRVRTAEFRLARLSPDRSRS